MRAGPLERRFPLFVGLRCMLFHKNGSIPFAVPPTLGLAQNLGFALIDLVADLTQQLLHQTRPTVIIGVDDKGKVPKEM